MSPLKSTSRHIPPQPSVDVSTPLDVIGGVPGGPIISTVASQIPTSFLSSSCSAPGLGRDGAPCGAAAGAALGLSWAKPTPPASSSAASPARQTARRECLMSTGPPFGPGGEAGIIARPSTELQRPPSSFVPALARGQVLPAKRADEGGRRSGDGRGVLVEDLAPQPARAGGQPRHVAEAGAGQGEVPARHRG